MGTTMHGEYKVPGGKLVVADLDIVDDQFRNVEISGDFFLEPPSALAHIAVAIEGMRSDSSEDDIARRVAAASEGAEMLGITPQGVAIAVRRATEAAL
jgi:lipoate---protein ligase